MNQYFALQALGAVLGAFMGAYFVQLGTSWTLGFKANFWNAFSATLLAYAAAVASGMFVAMAGMGKGGLVVLAVFYLVSAILYGRMLQHPETGPIGLQQGFRVAIVQLGFSLAAWTALVVALYMLPGRPGQAAGPL
jgi:hypothetical protein